MTTLSFYASGYSRNYRSDIQEIQAIEYKRRHITFNPTNSQQNWWPTSIDFQAAAEKSIEGGECFPVASASQLVRKIQRSKKLSSVKVFTHGSSSEIHFGRRGKITLDNIVQLPDLSTKFTANGKIIFYACNSARIRFNEDFFQKIANQIKVKTCGFTKGIKYKVHYNIDNRITKRGLDPSFNPNSYKCWSPQ